jgi:hypothetical protein
MDWRDGTYDAIYGIDLSTIDWERVANSSDECESAPEVIEDFLSLGSNEVAYGTDISSCGTNDRFGVWNRYTPNHGGMVTIKTDGSAFDTVLSVFDICGGTEIVCNDDYNVNHTGSRVFLNVVAGKSYLIRVAGFNGQVGNYDLLVTKGFCSYTPQGDLNGDCIVNSIDLAILTANWLDCGLSDQGDCW